MITFNNHFQQLFHTFLVSCIDQKQHAMFTTFLQEPFHASLGSYMDQEQTLMRMDFRVKPYYTFHRSFPYQNIIQVTKIFLCGSFTCFLCLALIRNKLPRIKVTLNCSFTNIPESLNGEEFFQAVYQIPSYEELFNTTSGSNTDQ